MQWCGRLLLSPTPAGWLATLPQAARTAAPWVRGVTRGATQIGAAEFWPPPGG
jgi:hypothetical protein